MAIIKNKSTLVKGLIIIVVSFLFIMGLLYIKHINDTQDFIESFKNNISEEEILNDKYLYPIKGLQNICAKDNLFPSFMPKACYVNGNLNSYSNCKCEDENGNCKICYPEIKKDSKNANVVYDASKESFASSDF